MAVHPVLLNTISEKAFQRQVIQAAKLLHWRVYHTFDSRRSEPGYPDLILIKPPQYLAIELKTERGRMRSEQKWWLDAMQACGIECHIWRPSMLDEIIARLQK